MKCLSTRRTAEGFTRRRYESATGHRSTTIEVPIELWNRVNSVGRQRDRAAQVMRTLDRESLKRQVRALVANGNSMQQAARAMQLPAATVRRWNKQGTER